jgi:type IV pilus assembly protein PilW
MRAHSHPRGLTLVELLVAMTVTAVVVAGSVVVANSQQKSFADGMRLRGAQGSARRALLALEQVLPTAGFGLDAPLAFDLQAWTTNPTVTSTALACPSTMGGGSAGCPVDSTSTSDELVFFARNPLYWIPGVNADDPVGNAWRIVGVTSSSVTVKARAGDVFRNGQIFQAVCPGSASYAYFTSAQTVRVTAAADTTIRLQGVVAANPFRRQDVAAALGCFSFAIGADPARLFLVDRFRFHVRPVATGTSMGATRYDPLLVLDRGVDMDLDGDVDEDDEQILAEGIESMQVAYGFYNGTEIPQAGTTAGTALTFSSATAAAAPKTAQAISTTLFPGVTPPTGKTAYYVSSFYPYTFGPPPATERTTNHQANIQAVRVAFLARSLETDIRGGASTRVDSFLPLLNQSAAPTWITSYRNALGGQDGYQRVVLETSVLLPNMATRAMTYF